jgi:hypothetical protein
MAVTKVPILTVKDIYLEQEFDDVVNDCFLPHVII